MAFADNGGVKLFLKKQGMEFPSFLFTSLRMITEVGCRKFDFFHVVIDV